MPRFGVPAGLGSLLASLTLPPTFAAPCLASFSTHAAASLPETGGWHGGQRQRSCPVLHGPGRTDGRAREIYPWRALPHGPAGVPAGRMLQEARTLREGKGAPRGATLLLKGDKTSRRKRAPGRTGTPNPLPPTPPRLTLPAGDAPPRGGRAADARSQQQHQQGEEAAAGTGTGSRHLHVLRDPPPPPGPGAGGRGRRPPCARQPGGERGWGGRGGAFTEPGREAEKEEVKEEEEEEEEAAAAQAAPPARPHTAFNGAAGPRRDSHTGVSHRAGPPGTAPPRPRRPRRPMGSGGRTD